MNVAQHLERAARHFPDRPAIIFEGRQISYVDLQVRVDRVAHGLVALGVETGDRVLLFLPNIPEFVIAYFAIQKVGAIAVSANVMLVADELRYLVEDSGATVLFTSATLAQSWQPLVREVLQTERVILCEGEGPEGVTLADFVAEAPSESFKARHLERDAPCAILYTSGTTGRQKGATLSHANVVANANSTVHIERIAPDDRLILFLPLFHVFGQNAIVNAAIAGGASVVLQRRYDLRETLTTIERDRVTMFHAVPTIYIGMLNAGAPPEVFASVRYFFSAAATMPVEIARRWQAIYGGPIFEGYGLTETSPFASYNHIWQHRPGSVGTAIPNVEIAILDPEDREVERGTWGEICIKGPNIMLGYWNRPEATSEAMRSGWFHSGDVGYMDDDDFIFIVDRTKDMINSAGFKIWPREVEEVLFLHPAIQECAVVGQSDDVNGEVPVAYVVLKADATLTPDAFDSYCRQKLAAYKVPRRVEFIDTLPKNPTGKILKRVLRDMANAVSFPI